MPANRTGPATPPPLHLWGGGGEEPGCRRVVTPPPPDAGEPNWPRHATGYLSDTPRTAPGPMPEPWPPAEAKPLVMEHFYDTLADRGYGYGPAFQGVRAAWRLGSDIFAEIALPEDTDTAGFTLHPALVDRSEQRRV